MSVHVQINKLGYEQVMSSSQTYLCDVKIERASEPHRRLSRRRRSWRREEPEPTAVRVGAIDTGKLRS